MKLNEIEVGGRYIAQVSGRLTVVKVIDIKQVPPASWSSRGSWRTLIIAVNEATGRRITIRSPQRLLAVVDRGCKFCSQAFNRPAGNFTCSYCQRVWQAAAG